MLGASAHRPREDGRPRPSGGAKLRSRRDSKKRRALPGGTAEGGCPHEKLSGPVPVMLDAEADKPRRQV